MFRGKTITLVLPCRNEENAIKAVIAATPKIVDEIIVVDNMSTDKTARVAKKLGAKVYLEPRKHNGIGYGYALATGIKATKTDIVVCMDGDGSYPVSQIRGAINKLLDNKKDFLSCNRLPVLEPKKMSHIRMSGVRILNLVINVLYDYPIKDSLTGMWVFKKEVIPALSLFEGGWNFSLEIKLNAITNKSIKFAEYHIPYKDRELDQSKQIIYKTGFEHFVYLFKWRLLRHTWPFSPTPAVSLLEA